MPPLIGVDGKSIPACQGSLELAGWMPMTFTLGTSFFRISAMPATLPPVPMDCTKTSSLPSVCSRISCAVT